MTFCRQVMVAAVFNLFDGLLNRLTAASVFLPFLSFLFSRVTVVEHIECNFEDILRFHSENSVNDTLR